MVQVLSPALWPRVSPPDAGDTTHAETRAAPENRGVVSPVEVANAVRRLRPHVPPRRDVVGSPAWIREARRCELPREPPQQGVDPLRDREVRTCLRELSRCTLFW